MDYGEEKKRWEAAPAAADVFAGIAAWGKFGVDFGIDFYAYEWGPCSQ